MARIETVDRDSADPRAQAQLDQVQKMMGGVPNILGTMAQSPAVLGSYLAFSGALKDASLSGALREQIALAVAGANSCDYCASAHTVLGKGQGVHETELARNLSGESTDERVAAALRFSRRLVETRGFVSDDDLSAVRSAGFSDGEVLEILATVAFNIFTNYFNHVAETEIDFPRVSAAGGAAV